MIQTSEILMGFLSVLKIFQILTMQKPKHFEHSYANIEEFIMFTSLVYKLLSEKAGFIG